MRRGVAFENMEPFGLSTSKSCQTPAFQQSLS